MNTQSIVTIQISKTTAIQIIHSLVKDKQYINAVILIRRVYDMGLLEAVIFYKSLPEYKKG